MRYLNCWSKLRGPGGITFQVNCIAVALHAQRRSAHQITYSCARQYSVAPAARHRPVVWTWCCSNKDMRSFVAAWPACISAVCLCALNAVVSHRNLLKRTWLQPDGDSLPNVKRHSLPALYCFNLMLYTMLRPVKIIRCTELGKGIESLHMTNV